MIRKGAVARIPISAIGINSERGITLLELLVVIVLLGLLSLIGAQALPGDDRHLQTVSERIEHRLRKARLSAMRSGTAVFIPCEFLAAPSDRTIPVTSSQSTDLMVICSGEVGRTEGITFFTDGSSSGGIIELVSEMTHRRIHIDTLTGTSRLE
ncbi:MULTISPECIES: prepilin-type N-terminal cleavage/methylation domain-containing protein [Nitrosomonas]|uniref:prepilin-type N-terminal cleavage/methylation domain-containing protein n=1 Tax=Nitrosomonas TaxID=914 RepID=UPI002109CB98|nr:MULTISPECIES: prepilin-type N-terminal cleavage/methylation domain-containing protein [Nitrosomonas]